MRRFVSSLVMSGALALLVSTAAAQSMPSADTREVMVKSWLMTFNDANLTNNYSVLRALVSKRFADQFSAEDFSKAFVSFRDNNIELSGILAYPLVEEPAPKIDANGDLNLTGYFETDPNYVTYELNFEGDEKGGWALIGINVHTLPPDEVKAQSDN